MRRFNYLMYPYDHCAKSALMTNTLITSYTASGREARATLPQSDLSSIRRVPDHFLHPPLPHLRHRGSEWS